MPEAVARGFMAAAVSSVGRGCCCTEVFFLGADVGWSEGGTMDDEDEAVEWLADRSNAGLSMVGLEGAVVL